MTLNPLPAKQAAARAYNLYNMASFVIGAEVANVKNVGVTLKDARGQAIAQRAVVDCYLSDAATGTPITATAPTSTVAVGTNGAILNAPVADKMFSVITNAQGKFDFNITQTAAPVTYYLVLKMPDGSLAISGPITFA